MRLRLAGMTVLVIASGCDNGELTERQAASAIEHHMNQELFPAGEDEGEFRVEVEAILIPSENYREVRGRMWFEVDGEVQDDEEETVIVGFVRATDGWRLMDYGSALSAVVAWNVTQELREEYSEVLEVAQAFRRGFQEHISHLLTAATAALETGTLEEGLAALELYENASSEETAHVVVEAMDEALLDGVEWRFVPGVGSASDIVALSAVDSDVECIISTESVSGSPPSGFFWAQGWEREACRGGSAPWLGTMATVDRATSTIFESGTWPGW